MKIKYFLPTAVILLSFLISSCDGIFPTQSKSTVPPDHSISRSGAMHKEGYQQPFDGCTECHGSDLKGGMYNEDGVQVACASCYQCHNAVWQRTGGGGGNVFKFLKQNSK